MATKKVTKQVTKKAMKLVFEGIKAPVYPLSLVHYTTSDFRIKDLRNKIPQRGLVLSIYTVDEKLEIIEIVTPKQTKTYYWLMESRILGPHSGKNFVPHSKKLNVLEHKPLYEVELVKRIGSSNKWIVKRK